MHSTCVSSESMCGDINRVIEIMKSCYLSVVFNEKRLGCKLD